MNTSERAKMMGEEKIPKVLGKLAMPAIIGLLVTAIYNIVDTFFVSMLGTVAISAVSVVYPLFLLLSAIGLMYGMGGASFTSRLLGQNKKEEANQVATTTTLTALGTAFLVTLFILFFMEPILKMLGTSPEIMPEALSYGHVLVYGAVFTIMNMNFNNLLRAEGSAKYSMIALSFGAVINMVLDPLFIFVFDMGVAGAALATVIAQAMSTLLLLSFYLRRMSVVHIHLNHFKPSKALYLELYKIGIPTFILQFLMSCSMGLLNSAASPYGPAAIASLGVVTKVYSLLTMVIFGFSQGFQPVAGYNYGAGKIERLKEAIKVSVAWTTVFCSISTVVYYVFAPQILGIFTNDPEVLTIGTRGLRAMILMFPLFGFQMIYSTLFQALGKAKQATILSLSRQGIFFVPAILFLPKVFDLNGVLFAQPLADFSTLILTLTFALKVNAELKDTKLLEAA